jgi:hypothetical protein
VYIYVEAVDSYDDDIVDSELVFEQTRYYTNDVIDESFSLGDSDCTATLYLGSTLGLNGECYFVVTFKVVSTGYSGVHLDSDCDSKAILDVDSIRITTQY